MRAQRNLGFHLSASFLCRKPQFNEPPEGLRPRRQVFLRTSTTRLRVSCPTSRTSEHSRAGARGCDVRMFGCLPLDGPHREGGLLAGLRTYLPLSRTTLTQQFFGSAPQISATLPQRHRQFCASSSI